VASVRNRRSFIYVENLADAIVACLGNPNAKGKTFLPCDGENVSTAELIAKIEQAGISGGQSVAPRTFSFPPPILKAMGRLPGLGALRKLTASLCVDSGPMRQDLGWVPPFTMNEGLARTICREVPKSH
jgi:nucleoside-diphosphate-sugar epimerase